MRPLLLIDRITGLAAWLGMLLVLPLVGAMIFEVFSRYLFNAPTTWAFETSYMLMSAIFALGIAEALRSRAHVCVDLLSERLPPRLAAGLEVLGLLVFVPGVAWIVYGLANFALSAYASGERSGLSAWNPVIWPYRAVLAVGFAVFFLQCLATLARALRRLRTGEA